MNRIEEIRQVFESNGGMLRTKDLYVRRIFYNDIQQFIKDGAIEKIRYGYYQIVDADNLCVL